MSSGVRQFLTLTKTELKLTLRSLDMVIFAVIMPVVVLVIVGVIFGDAGHGPAAGMIADTFGAFLAIGICAVGLMGLPLTLAEYRHRKVLKRLQVTPVHPGLLLAVQLSVQSLVAVVSAVLVTLAAGLIFGLDLAGSPAVIIGAFFLVLVSIFSLGLMIASTARDVRRAGMVASIVYFPMLLFSGTTIPFPVFPEGVQRVASVLPLRHGISLLNGVVLGERLSTYLPEIGILVAISIVGIAVSVKTFRWDLDA